MSDLLLNYTQNFLVEIHQRAAVRNGDTDKLTMPRKYYNGIPYGLDLNTTK